MKNNKLLQNGIKKLVKNSFKDGRLVESKVINSIKLLKSLPSYEAIQALSEYLKDLKRETRQHTLYVEAVIPPSSAQINKIKKIIGKRVKITAVQVNINPEILGGFKLRVGDEVSDHSIMGKLTQIKQAMTN